MIKALLSIIFFLLCFSCKKGGSDFLIEERGSSTVIEKQQYSITVSDLDSKKYNYFNENGLFVINYIDYQEYPQIYVGNNGLDEIASYIDLVKERYTPNNKVLNINEYIHLLCVNAKNGDNKSWLALHQIAIDSGFEIMEKTNIKAIAYDPYNKYIMLDDLNKKTQWTGPLDKTYSEFVFAYPLVEFYLQYSSQGNTSLLNIDNDKAAKEHYKRIFDNYVDEYFPNIKEEYPDFKKYDEIAKL